MVIAGFTNINVVGAVFCRYYNSIISYIKRANIKS